MAADPETGEMVDTVTIKAAGRSVTMTGEEFHRVADLQQELPGLESTAELVFWETQGAGQRKIQVSLEHIRESGLVKIVVPGQPAPVLLHPFEADTLKGMLDRAVKAAKKMQ